MTRPWPLATLLTFACTPSGPPSSAATTDRVEASEDAATPADAAPAGGASGGGEPLAPHEDPRLQSEACDFSRGLERRVPCPPIAARPGPARLAAKGARARLVADPEAFLRSDVDVSDAIALFGSGTHCFLLGDSRRIQISNELRRGAPRGKTTTVDGDLRVLEISYRKPRPVDLAELRRALGDSWPATTAVHPSSGPVELFESSSPAQLGQVAIERMRCRDKKRTECTIRVHYGRSPRDGRLPDALAHEGDLVRLLAHMLGPTRPERSEFDGVLGPLHVGHRPVFHYYNSARRNIAQAHVRMDESESVEMTELSVTFAAPVITTAEQLVRGLARALQIPEPKVVREGDEAAISVLDDDARIAGSIRLRLSGATVTSLVVARRPGYRGL